MSTNVTVKTESILKEMSTALKIAHTTNNVRAISKDFAAGAGVSEEAFESWCTWVRLLYDAATPWAEKYNNKDIKDADLQKIYKSMFPIIRQLAKADDKLFVRESDAISACRFAAEFGKSATGSVDVVCGLKTFRRKIETMLGNRMAQNAALTEKEYETVTKYETATKSLEKAKNKLDGYERDGKPVPGLKDKLAEAKKVYEDMSKALGITDEIREELKKAGKNIFEEYPLITGYFQALANVESDVKNTVKRIGDTEKYISENKTKYEDIIAKVPKME